MLINIKPAIDLTYEQETDNTLPFFDILLINNNKQEFKVNLKSANKNDHIPFFSYYNTKIKCGIIIGVLPESF